jgi:hypothetical protein
VGTRSPYNRGRVAVALVEGIAPALFPCKKGIWGRSC